MKAPGMYAFAASAAILILALSLSGCRTRKSGSLSKPLESYQQEITSPLKRLRLQPNQTVQLPVMVKNPGREFWVSRGSAPVLLSYRWVVNGVDLAVEGERTALPGILGPGEAIPVNLRVVAVPQLSDAQLNVSLVQESVTWFMSSGGTALQLPVQISREATAPVDAPLSSFSQDFQSSFAQLNLSPQEQIVLPVTLRNPGGQRWSSGGKFPLVASYKWFEGDNILPLEGARTFLPGTVDPGETVTIPLKVVAPPAGRNLRLNVTLVQEGVAWFMSKGARAMVIPVALK